MIVKTSVVVDEFTYANEKYGTDCISESVEVDLDCDDIAKIISKHYKIDFKIAREMAFDLDLDNSQALKEFFEYELEDYARDKYYRDCSSEEDY